MAYVSQYPPAQSATYVKATTTLAGDYYPYNATDPTNSLTGGPSGNQWYSESGALYNKINIDLGEAVIITRLYIENGNESGAYTGFGIKGLEIYGTNSADAFANTTYVTLTDLTLIDTIEVAQHVASDVADPQYFALDNITAYQYIVLRVVTSWSGASQCSVRRIECQAGGEAVYIDINSAFVQPVPVIEGVVSTESFINTELLQYVPEISSELITESFLSASIVGRVSVISSVAATDNVIWGRYVPPPPKLFGVFGADCSFVAPRPVISGAVLTENVVTCGYVAPSAIYFCSVVQANNITASMEPRLPSISGVSLVAQGNDVVGQFVQPIPRISGLAATENLGAGRVAPGLPRVDSLLSAPQFYQPIVHRRDGLCNTNWITGAVTAPLAVLAMEVE